MEATGTIIVYQEGVPGGAAELTKCSSRATLLAHIQNNNIRKFGWNVFHGRLLAYKRNRMAFEITFVDPFTYGAIKEEAERRMMKRYGKLKKKMRCVEIHRLILKEMEP